MRLADTINASLDRAGDYLLKNLGSDNLWRDFYTKTHGESIDWVTAYVGNSLYGSCNKAILGDVAKSLADRQNKNGGWGYNHKIIPDTDSTTFSILFLSNFEEFKEQTILAKQFLLHHQKQNGGFATYNPDEIKTYYRIPQEMSVKGWCSELPETTSIAVKALRKFDNPKEVGRGVSYIQSQQVSGKWRSYWWNNDIYATSQCLISIDDPHAKNLAREWLLECSVEIPFYIGISIEGLGGLTEREKRIERLLSLQKQDGSWESFPILRFPNPNNTQPWIDPGRWREDAKDQNSLFTTATIFKALSSYLNTINRA